MTHRRLMLLWALCNFGAPAENNSSAEPYSLRLVGRDGRCHGELQVQRSGLDWTGVDPYDLSLHFSHRVCAELNCGSALSVERRRLSEGAVVHVYPYNCEDTSLIHCFGNDPFDFLKVELNCSGAPAENNSSAEPYSLRLVGGDGQCQGELQVQRSGLDWTGVYPFGLYMHLGHRVCAELDCGSALSVEWENHPQGAVVLAFPDKCENTSLIHCFGTHIYFTDSFKAQLNCSDSVRLVSGQSGCSGSLQIWNQSWTSVCEGALDRRGAEVLCRELGCGAPLLQEALSPLEQTFHCEGNESALMDCPRNKSTTCSRPALNLTCSEPLRLEGGASRCEGTVNVRVRGEWRRVKRDRYEPLDLETVAAVCRDLYCGSAVSGEVRDGFPETRVRRFSAACVKKNSVRGCTWDTSAVGLLSSTGLDLVCSDLLNSPVVSVSEEVSAPRAQGGVRVLMGADFWVKCSVEPQYPGGSFQLLSPTSNFTLPAVNHSAHFLLSDAGHAHKGNYTCVYHLHVFNHSFSSQSRTLQIDLGTSDFQIFIRALILLLLQLLYIVPNVYCYCQASRGRRRSPRRASP